MAALTIRDIAKMAEVSPTAVSFVINHREGVSEETRKRVLDIIQRTGYTPNIHTRRLNLGKSFAIHVVLRHYEYPLHNQFVLETLNGIFSASKSMGYSVIFTSVNDKMGFEQVIESIRSKDCDGVILYQFADFSLISALRKENIPFVCIDCHVARDSGLPMVEVNYYEAAYQATKYLCDNGHRDIGFIGADIPQNYHSATFSGYLAALKEANLVCNPAWLFSTSAVEVSSEAEIGKFLRSITLPTAFFCAGDSYAIDTIRCAKVMGLRIPEDLSVIGLDDLLVSRYLDPPLTSLSFDKEGIGSKATELLYWKGRFDMTDEKPCVIIIPPKPELQQTTTVTKQLRVAAYCRVSTKEEEQASSYEAQCEYYTDKIMSNKDWTMAGIFADEGITGTSTKKRTEFLRMIRQCKQKKIDLILTKSIQRFARNTLDCINYTRILRQLGIGVLFEKENINSLPADSEFMITMYGAMAQSESESISGNIRRGRQMHAKVGTLKVPCYRLYGYEKDEDGKFRIIPEQAEIVRELYKRYESGASLRNLQDWLEENQIKTVLGESKWTTTSIKSILTNEKYCGDVLLQKTFRTDVISKKVIKNVGQMAQYYMPDHHEAIVSRERYNAVKAEMARRSALRSPSKQAVTGRSCYTSKYALSDRIVCGECGTLYRRCTWTSRGRKYPVWRCTSRLNYGTKYCHDSPTIKEEPLQNAILAAINAAMSDKPVLLDLIKNAVSLELLPVQGQTMSLADIERRLAQLDEQFQQLLTEAIDAEDKEACNAQFAEILAEQTSLKKQKEAILQSSTDASCVCTRMKQAEQAIENATSTITEWNENAVRQTVERVTVLSAEEILVQIKGGAEIKQRLER